MSSQWVASRSVFLKMNFKKFFSGFPCVPPCVWCHYPQHSLPEQAGSHQQNSHTSVLKLSLSGSEKNWHTTQYILRWPQHSFFWHQLCNSNGKETVMSFYMLHEASTHFSFSLSLLNRLFKIIGQFLSKLKHRGQDYQCYWRKAISEYGEKTAGVLL